MRSKITNDLNEFDDIYTQEDFRNPNEQLYECMHSDSNKWNFKDLGILCLI